MVTVQKKSNSLLSYNIDSIILSENHHFSRTLKMLEIANIPVVEIMDSNDIGIQQAIGYW